MGREEFRLEIPLLTLGGLGSLMASEVSIPLSPSSALRKKFDQIHFKGIGIHLFLPLLPILGQNLGPGVVGLPVGPQGRGKHGGYHVPASSEGRNHNKVNETLNKFILIESIQLVLYC